MSKAYEVFEQNYSFTNKDQGKNSDISAWSLMCWREAFKWGYDFREKEIVKYMNIRDELQKENRELRRKLNSTGDSIDEC